jgi:hypothetical protein
MPFVRLTGVAISPKRWSRDSVLPPPGRRLCTARGLGLPDHLQPLLLVLDAGDDPGGRELEAARVHQGHEAGHVQHLEEIADRGFTDGQLRRSFLGRKAVGLHVGPDPGGPLPRK